jgi:hypothetical protein
MDACVDVLVRGLGVLAHDDGILVPGTWSQCTRARDWKRVRVPRSSASSDTCQLVVRYEDEFFAL